MPPAPRVKKFTEHDMNVDPKTVTMSKELGRGNFSKVYLGMYQGRKVAVKVQQLEFTEMLKYLLNELAILNHLKHPGCIAFYGMFFFFSPSLHHHHYKKQIIT
jgi:serine/threonine protein kinase